MGERNELQRAHDARRERFHRAAQFEKLALHWAQRGDLRQAALALRRARLEAQTALLESYRELAEQGH